jgi:signal peptidase I
MKIRLTSHPYRLALALSGFALIALAGSFGIAAYYEKQKVSQEASCFSEVQKIVQGQSMEPLFQDGTTVRVLMGYYACHPIERGDIILADFPGIRESFILKQVRAIPGDRLALTEENGLWHIWVNGTLLTNATGSAYALSDALAQLLQNDEHEYGGVIPERYYLVLGEMPEGSFDSSRAGLFFQEMIVAKVLRNENE